MCTNIGATGRAVAALRKVFIGGVSDDPYDIRTKVIVHQPADGYAFIGTHLAPLASSASDQAYSDSVSGAPTRGLNEAGLAFTWTLALEKPENRDPEGAMKPHDVWAAVMTQCADVDAAIALLQRLPRGFAGVGMLADRSGALTVIEIGRKRVHVSERLAGDPGGTAVNVNCWIQMQAEEGAPICSLDNDRVPNRSRYLRAKELLAQTEGDIDLETMAALLCDHAHKDRFAGENPWIPGHGYSICNHGSLNGDHFDAAKPAWGSVSAEIIDPVDGVFWYAYGWPCGLAPDHGDQMLQDRSWGHFVGFPLADMPAGDYTTLTGELTHLALRHWNRLLHMAKPGNVAARASAA